MDDGPNAEPAEAAALWGMDLLPNLCIYLVLVF